MGNERFLADIGRYIGRRRIGLVINQTSFTPRMESLLHRCLAAGVNVSAIFGPEHGVAGVAQDMESVGGSSLLGIPVFSLYGATEASLSPTPEALGLVDALVFDIQDVGSRYYTFLWTLALCMRACAAAEKEMIVLDRPNPLGGAVVAGPVQQPGFLSFVGLYPVPVRHGLTAGEAARMFAGHFGAACPLTVVPMEGWRREMWWDETGLPWIPPSPNMPALSTAIVYPGGCLIEGTNLSEGRGTATPFETIGAPGIDGAALAERLASLRLPGCIFRPVEFVPQFQKRAGKTCGGVFVHVTGRDAFDAFAVYCHVIEAAASMFPNVFSWRTGAYEFVRDIPAIDLLTGSDRFRKAVSAGVSAAPLLAAAKGDAASFEELRASFLLY